jgi:hypothetical protein
LRSVIGEDNAPMPRSSDRATPALRRPKGRRGCHGVAREPKLDLTPSSVRPTGVGLLKGGLAPRRRTTRQLGPRAHVGESGRTCVVDAVKAACSVIERCSGARVVSRLQKSVRSIFPELQRGEPRGKPRARGVAQTRGSSLDEAESMGPAKGCEELVANVTGTGNTPRSTARLGIEPTEGVLGPRPAASLTRWWRARPWHRDWLCP